MNKAANERKSSKCAVRKQFEEADMEKAMALVQAGSCSGAAAARLHNVPKETLRRRIIRGPPKHTGPRHFTEEDEKELMGYLRYMQICKQHITIEWFRTIAGRMAIHRGKPFPGGVPTRGWWNKFKKRHPEFRTMLNFHNPENKKSKIQEKKKVFRIILEEFFSNIGDCLEDVNIFDDHKCIYSIGELSFCHDDGANANSVKITMCISASGDILPTMFTYSRSQITDRDFDKLGPANALYNSSELYSTDGNLYLDYFKHLEPHLNSSRPVVILQHKPDAYENLELMEFCVTRKIYLLNIPNVVSHLVQPLETIFSELTLQVHEHDMSVTVVLEWEAAVATIVRSVTQGYKKWTIQNMFLRTGICPFDNNSNMARYGLGGESCDNIESVTGRIISEDGLSQAEHTQTCLSDDESDQFEMSSERNVELESVQ